MRPILSSAGALGRLDIGPAPSMEPDDDPEIDFRLALVWSPQENAAALMDDPVLHLMSSALRRRMRQEGRELARLPIDDLKAVLVQVCDGADSTERWTWRYDAWTPSEAAILECEYRAEESDEDRLDAICNAQVLREPRAVKTEEARVWWDRLPSGDREFLLARRPETLSDDDCMVVAERCHVRMHRRQPDR